MKVRYIGETFGGGVLGLTNGKIYECLGIEYGFLRVIDDEGEDYLYSATEPGPIYDANIRGRWELIQDNEGATGGSMAKELKAMSEQMNLETYKQKVRECLLKTYNCTGQEANKLMTDYEDDFQEALSKFSWSPATMALAMQKGY